MELVAKLVVEPCPKTEGLPDATMSCDGLAGSVGGSSLLVSVRSLVHVPGALGLCVSWSFTERHQSVCQCLSLFPAERLRFCVSRSDQLKDIREQLQALSSVDVLETWGQSRTIGNYWHRLVYETARAQTPWLWLCLTVLRSGQLNLLRDIKLQQGQVISCLDASVAQRASEILREHGSLRKAYVKYIKIYKVYKVYRYRSLQSRRCIVEPTRIASRHVSSLTSPLQPLATIIRDPRPSLQGWRVLQICLGAWRNAKQVFRSANAHYLSASDLDMGILCV